LLTQKFNQIYKAFEAAEKKITTAQQTLNYAAALVKIAACECPLLLVVASALHLQASRLNVIFSMQFQMLLKLK